MKHKGSAMLRAMRLGFLSAMLSLLAAAPLLAQIAPAPASKGYINVSAGAQPMRQSVENVTDFQKYGEPTSVKMSQPLGNGPIFDIGGGYKVWEDLYIGVGFSSFSKTGDSTLTGRIPNPLIFDQFKNVEVGAKDLEHKERNVYVQASWLLDITEKIDLAVFGGAAFVGVTQGLINYFAVQDGTQNLVFTTDTQTAHTTGGIIGVDGTYLIRRNVGVGVLLRYVGATVNFPGFGDVKAGGFHAGLGARYRF